MANETMPVRINKKILSRVRKIAAKESRTLQGQVEKYILDGFVGNK